MGTALRELSLGELWDEPEPIDEPRLRALVLLGDRPVGHLELSTPLPGSVGATLSGHVGRLYGDEIAATCVEAALAATPRPMDPLLLQPGSPAAPAAPLDLPLDVSVVVCTRDRAVDLERCLQALSRSDPAPLEVIVVDNASRDDETREVAGRYDVRYIREDRPGLDWARNRGVQQARGEVVAYTDDDCEPDRHWVAWQAKALAEDPSVGCVTGLVVPARLDTTAQEQFERLGGFGRGYRRRWWRAATHVSARALGGTGQCGTGANMAFRRQALLDVGGFDPALDVGTPSNGGGDLEMYFRILKAGWTVTYEPAAIVRHHHRPDEAGLARQMSGWGTGSGSYLTRSFLAYPEERLAVLRLSAWWLRYLGEPYVGSLLHPGGRPDLTGPPLRGFVLGPLRYRAARRGAQSTARRWGGDPELVPGTTARRPSEDERRTAVHRLELTQPIASVPASAGVDDLRVVAFVGGTPVGHVDVTDADAGVSAARLRHLLAHHLSDEIVAAWPGRRPVPHWRVYLADAWLAPVSGAAPGLPATSAAKGRRATGQIDPTRALPAREPAPEPLPRTSVGAIGVTTEDASAGLVAEPVAAVPLRASPALDATVGASIVIATLHRPEVLRRCLIELKNLQVHRPLEIVVVDNDPSDASSRAVVAQHPGVVYVPEGRRGLSWARNAGIRVARYPIVVTTDDDVEVSSDWLENLIAPFARPDVGAVTGLTLPAQLATESQRAFERYGGLSRGYRPRDFTHDWFSQARHRAATWDIGATANAAFRISALQDPDVGLFPEDLGAGSAGVGEDTYVFYRLLKARWVIAYEPSALVWHTHRETYRGLDAQIFAYSRGHIAYHLKTAVDDGDLRGLWWIAVGLPTWAARRLIGRGGDMPLRLLPVEIAGWAAGPRAFVQHRRRARELLGAGVQPGAWHSA